MPVINTELSKQINLTQEKVNNVLKYIEENPYSDPNAYEMNELLYEVTNLKTEGWNMYSYDFLNEAPMSNLIHNFSKMMNIRMEQLVTPDTGLCESKNDSLYKYFERNMKISTGKIGNKKAQEASSKACAINLYVKQRLRQLDMSGKEEIIYDNGQELNDLLTKLTEENIEYYSHPEFDIKDLLEDVRLAYNHTPKEFKQAKKIARKEAKLKESENPNIY